MSWAATRPTRRRLLWLLLPCLALVAGCKTTSVPSGGGWKSVSATRTLGLAMTEAMKNVDLSVTKGRQVTVTSAGFEKDEVGSYLRLLVRERVHEAGGTTGPDGELLAEVQVHVSGVDRIRVYFIPFFDTTTQVAVIDAELVIRDRASELVTRQPLKGAAQFEEAIVLSFFTLPATYYVRHERAWIKVDSAESFLDDFYWHAVGFVSRSPPQTEE